MDASNRDRRITFERAIEGTNEFNEPVKTWAAFCKEWAAVNFGTGQERRDAAQESASYPAIFMVLRNNRTRALTTADRINYDGAVWDITGVVPSRQRNDGFDITAVRAA